jgi:hypothetical protein
MSEDGKIDLEVKKKIQERWINWKSLSGVLCEKK